MSLSFERVLAELGETFSQPPLEPAAGTDSGLVNAYVYTHSGPLVATLSSGTLIRFTPAHTNTGPSTINVNGTGVVAVVGVTNAALVGGELSSLGPVMLQYNGTAWQIIATTGTTPIFGATGAGTESGAVNAYIYTHNSYSLPATLSAGTLIRFIPLNTNTGASTLNADGSGAVAIIRANGAALTGGELSSLGPVVLQSTGTQWQIVSTAGAQPGYERTAAEIAAGVTPTNYAYPPGDVRRYGAVGNGNGSGGGTNDYTALANALLVAANGGPPPQLMPATHRCDTALTVPNNIEIRGYGPELSVIDGTNVPGSTGAVLNCTGPAFVSLPALSSDVAVGDTTLTFSSAPTVNIGDKVIIWNPTNSSYSGFRTYYTAGEACEVIKLAGSVVTTKTPIYAAYSHTAVNMYQLVPKANHFVDLSVIAPASAVQGINFTRIVAGGTTNVKIRGSGYIQIENLNCYDMTHVNGDCFELLNISNGYGISFDNSQDCLVVGGKYAGYFSGISTGGSSQTGSHVNRNIRAIGATTASVQHVQGNGSANMHGNSEFCYYDNCTIFDGLNLAGNHCGARNSTIIVSSASLGVGVLFTEMSGCDHDLTGTQIIASGNPNSGSSAVIDIGVNNVTAMNTSTTVGGTLRFNNMKISAPSATGNIVFVRNRGSTVTYEVDCTGMQVDAASTTGAAVSTIPVSGNDPVALHMTDARFTGTTLPGNTIPFVSITAGNTKVLGYRCQGSTAISTGTTTIFVTQAATFPRPAPKTPNIFCSLNQAVGGSTDSYIVTAASASTTGFNVEVVNGKAVNFGTNVALTAAWTAMLDESV